MNSPTARLDNLLRDWRHDLHAHPELGFEERRTAAFVADRLREFGLETHERVGGTGVVGVLKRGEGGRIVALRADMDALPIMEAGDAPHRSRNSGVMHACGHDGHTTMLLGAAKHLSEAGEFNGSAVFIFQPNEEHGLGAQAMLRDGLVERFRPDEVYGMHNLPGMALGDFGVRVGPITASESLFEIRIHAAGGHAALPHMGVDAIIVGAEIVQTLQTIVSRKLNPGLNGVVSVTEFVTDGKRNVLPGEAVISGDARALTPEINSEIEAKMRRIVEGVCLAHGVSADVGYETIFPAVINAAAPTEAALGAARAASPKGRIDEACEPKLFSEDFAHFAAVVPGCFILMGNGLDGAHGRPLHSADYDFNDAALTLGADYWVRLVEQRLA